MYLIDVAIPGDSRVTDKVTEKHQQYTDLKLELQKLQKMQVVIPLSLVNLEQFPFFLKNI